MEMEDEQLQAREVLGGVARRVPRYLRLAARLIRDDRLSAWQKAPLIGAVGYGLSPIDLVPGIIPVFGQLDDLLLLLSALRRTINHAPTEIANEHLMVVGLERHQLDTDLDEVGRLTRRLSANAARGAARLAWKGARMTGRAAQRGVRALRER